MQNYNNPAQPPPPHGGHGTPPRPHAKKGTSAGVKILIAALVLLVGGGVLVVALAIGGVYYFSRGAREAASATGPGLSGLTGTGAGMAEAEPPAPTAEQRAAIAGGQTAVWQQQEISWTVPQRWKKHSGDSTQLLWRSPGSSDAASLIVNVSPMAADFPSDISLKSYYDTYTKDRQKYADVRWLRLGGVKGVVFRETSPESADDAQRLQWLGFRDYKGQKQMVNIMLAARGKDFARHEDALYGILYSTELGR